MNQPPGKPPEKPPGALLTRASTGVPAGAERRRDLRYPSQVPLVLTRHGLELVARTEDVSFTGIYFRTDTPLPERQLVRLKLTLPPTAEELIVMGMVTRCVPASAGLPPGVGIQFYALAPAERRRWGNFIRQVAAGLPVAAAPPPAAALPPEPVRRHHPRYAAALQVLLHSVDDLRVLYTRNISKGGLFVATTLPVAEGTSLKVSVVHPKSREQFTFEAVVRRRSTGPEPGIALEFVEVTEADRDDFFEFISSEIPVEEVVYVTEGDVLLARSQPPDTGELVDLSEMEQVPEE